jgi:hypothetical protein
MRPAHGPGPARWRSGARRACGPAPRRSWSSTSDWAPRVTARSWLATARPPERTRQRSRPSARSRSTRQAAPAPSSDTAARRSWPCDRRARSASERYRTALLVAAAGWPLGGEVSPDGRAAVADMPIVVGMIGLGQMLIQLGYRLNDWDRDQVAAAEPADLASTPPLSCAPRLPGWQKQESNPSWLRSAMNRWFPGPVAACRMRSTAARRLSSRIRRGIPPSAWNASTCPRGTPLGGLASKCHRERRARCAQPQHNQPHLGQGRVQPHPQLPEVDLGLLAGWVDLGTVTHATPPVSSRRSWAR